MNNIFSALMHKRDGGVIREFVLWCILCFEILLFMIAAIVAGSKASWILLMLFTMGLAALLAFRLTAIALLYSVGTFYLIAPLIHYICYRSGSSVISILLFVLLLLLSLAALICSFVHNFTMFNLDKLIMILVIVDSVFQMILHIVLYVGRNSLYGIFSRFMSYNAIFSGYWAGTIGFWIMLIVISLYEVFFVLGLIDNSWNKIIQKNGSAQSFRAPRIQRTAAGLQGVSGECAGQIFYLNKGDLIIGTDRRAGAQLTLSDGRISRWHCAVRFRNGFYEIFDRSTNGVYVNSKDRIPAEVWIRLQPGAVIGIAGTQHQFRLL